MYTFGQHFELHSDTASRVAAAVKYSVKGDVPDIWDAVESGEHHVCDAR